MLTQDIQTNTQNTALNVVIIGATGAVGTEVVRTLITQDNIATITLLGRREFTALTHDKIIQHIIDIEDPSSYSLHLNNMDAAICTLGVGQPSKTSKAAFLKIDRDAVLNFGHAAKEADITHFSLLSSIGANSRSASFFLRSKGELEDGLKALSFRRLSLFHPSMILTPTNRYGFSQALTLAIWPLLTPLLIGPLKKARGIRVATLGQAFARNLALEGSRVEVLTWQAFINMARSQ
ncbi:NAD(P)H-binding protein [Marinagarivorans algicola]|uniref:NAD(P)H-binding protein n=1 Tax=Marinagarivorans algicola TaxID=1513270 RepID=UPI0006B9F4E9|nr:NAD(P)H-binding protein [Marinagarivorans algicola]